jgi:hypothetical protein
MRAGESGQTTGEKRQVFELPFPPASLSGHHNAHWRTLQPVKKLWRTYAETATAKAGIAVPADGDIRIAVTFYPPDRSTQESGVCLDERPPSRTIAPDAPSAGIDRQRSGRG